jgi:hypothetical protein
MIKVNLTVPSSLLRAGLVPAMADEPGWAVLAPFVPGSDPVAGWSGRLLTPCAAHPRIFDNVWTMTTA